MRADRAVNTSELRELARRRLPRVLFDYIDGGAGDESGIARNARAWGDYRLLPRYLVNVSARSLATQLWSRQYAAPFGIAPVGLTGLFRPQAERLLAEAAREAGLPYILSGVAIAGLEEIAKIAPGQVWFQLYAARQRSIALDMIRRAAAAGIEVLVLTVDLPVDARRERDLRNGFRFGVRFGPSLVLDGLTHPRWTLNFLRHGGLPSFDGWARYLGPDASAGAVGALVDAESYAPQTWADLELYRREWPGRLVVKGLLHADDARRALDCGVDGIIVSNHGGRQLERLPSVPEVLPAIVAAVGGRLKVMCDSGIRCGADIAVARCLGAEFVFTGRVPIYGVAAGGRAGAARALAILTEELDRAVGQIGVTANAGLSRERLLGPWPDPPAPCRDS